MYIPTKDNTKTITQVRENALGVLRDASQKGLVYITHHSQPQAVLVDIDEFVAIQEMLEEYQDITDAKRLDQEPRGKGVPLDQVIDDQK